MVEFDRNLATRKIPVFQQTSNTACYVRIQHHHSYELYLGSDEMKTQKIHIITWIAGNSALCKTLQSV